MSPKIDRAGLRFLFPTGAFVDVVLPTTDALELIELWTRGDAKGRVSGSKPSSTNKSQADWSVSLDHCCAIHLVDLPVTPHIPPTGFTGGSGL